MATLVTVPSPRCSLSSATSWGAIMRSWVAQAVESVRTVSTVSAYASGRECSALTGPTSGAQRASSVCTLISVAQPLARPGDRRRRTAAWGRGRRDGRRRPAGRCCAGRAYAAGAGSRRPTGRPCGPDRDRSGRAGVGLRRRGSSGSRAPVCCWARGGGPGVVPLTGLSGLSHAGDDLAVGHLKRRPCSCSGTSAPTAAVTSTCSAALTPRGQPLPPGGVELGEHVVQDQHRLDAVGAEQAEAAQLQGQRERPGLAVAGVPPGRQRPEARRGRRGAARPGRAALDLVGSALRHRGHSAAR